MIDCCCLSWYSSLWYSSRPTFTEKDVNDIVNFGIKHKVDFIAASFMRKESDVKNLRQLLAENGGHDIKIIAKLKTKKDLRIIMEFCKPRMLLWWPAGTLAWKFHPARSFLRKK